MPVPTIVSSLNEEDVNGYLPQDEHFSTRALHSGYTPSENDYMAVVPPIVLATTYEQLAPAVPKVRFTWYSQVISIGVSIL